MVDEISEEEVESLLDEYRPIVTRIARSAFYSSAAIDVNDLIRVGEFAVLQAVKAYDPTCGTTIRSFVSRVVRNEIFHEAARFLGVFTVDHRVTSLAAKVNKLHAKGQSDTEIAEVLNASGSRNFDADHVRDLRIAYSRRQHSALTDDDALEEYSAEENTIQELLRGVVQNPIEQTILDERILGDKSVKDVACILCLSQRQVYDLENQLKDRIRKAIEDVTE